MKQHINQKVMITGASSGIGRAFARAFAREGYSLILTGRSRERLLQVKEEIRQKNPTAIEIVTADLCNPEELNQLLLLIQAERPRIVINNAGSGRVGPYVSEERSAYDQMIAANVIAFEKITSTSAEMMEENGGGYLLNVASSAGLFPAGPYMAIYYATKAFAASLTLSVASEYRRKKSPVYIGCLCPGPVNTEFNKRAGVTSPLKGISPEHCVSYTIRQMKRKKTLIIPAFSMRLACSLGRLVPLSVITEITGKQQLKKLQ